MYHSEKMFPFPKDTGSELRDPEGDPVSESLRRALAEFQAG